MRKNRDFDIITGEQSSMTRRSFSQADQILNTSRVRRLGSPRDQKEFQYAYFERLQPSPQHKYEQNRALLEEKRHLDTSMLNCVSTPYNIINHSGQHPTSKIISHDMFNLVIDFSNRNFLKSIEKVP